MEKQKERYKSIFNVMEFGACADGSKDDTQAFQNALDAARTVEGKVVVPAGIYRISTIQVYEGVSLYGDAAWGGTDGAGGTRILFDGPPDAKCCIDISDAYGCIVHGLNIEGGKKGDNVCGIYLDRKGTGKDVEDTSHIEHCRVANFTADGLHYNGIWCDSVRHCLFEDNARFGIFVSGWDIFFFDNVLRHNGQGGLCCLDNAFNSITAQNNRFEENNGPGLQFKGGNMATFMGNSFFDNCGPGVEIGDRGQVTNSFSLLGNTFRGNGRTTTGAMSCQIYADFTHNFLLSGNTFLPGEDGFAPSYCVTHKRLWATQIQNNTMTGAMHTAAFYDLGGKNGYVTIADNVGTLPGALPLSFDA